MSRAPSRTAEIVAVSRARHLLRHAAPHVFEDPYALRLIGPSWRRIITSRVLDWLVSGIVVRRLMPVTTQHLTRARFAEDALERAVEGGATQCVILGAGLDTCALRRPELGLTVFEVDLAESIAWKKERLAAAGIRVPPRLRFVPVDFEADDLAAELLAAGFDPRRPSFFIWMGVTYYLTDEAIRGTLAKVAAAGEGGCEIVFDYLVAAERVPSEDRALFTRMMAFVAKRGEPMISRLDPGRAKETLDPQDAWEVVRNDSPRDQRRQYLAGRTDMPPLAPIAWCMHLRKRMDRGASDRGGPARPEPSPRGQRG